jgi:hypothetical protein
MADPHVISALREKRALVTGLIEKLERKLEQHRADLTHIDGVLRLFQPDRDPGEIKPKRVYNRRTPVLRSQRAVAARYGRATGRRGRATNDGRDRRSSNRGKGFRRR